VKDTKLSAALVRSWHLSRRSRACWRADHCCHYLLPGLWLLQAVDRVIPQTEWETYFGTQCSHKILQDFFVEDVFSNLLRGCKDAKNAEIDKPGAWDSAKVYHCQWGSSSKYGVYIKLNVNSTLT